MENEITKLKIQALKVYDSCHLHLSHQQAQLNVLVQLLTLEAFIYSSQMYVI